MSPPSISPRSPYTAYRALPPAVRNWGFFGRWDAEVREQIVGQLAEHRRGHGAAVDGLGSIEAHHDHEPGVGNRTKAYHRRIGLARGVATGSGDVGRTALGCQGIPGNLEGVEGRLLPVRHHH